MTATVQIDQIEPAAIREELGDSALVLHTREVRGSGDEDYVLSDKRFFPMKTRWTATVAKDASGKWRILTLHIGTNFLDNPILSMAENSAKYFAAGGAGVGLILGLIFGFFWGRRK